LWLLRMLCIWLMGSSCTSPITFLYKCEAELLFLSFG
jgi:hypothetical protein